MRFILGVIVGFLLTVVGAYIADSSAGSGTSVVADPAGAPAVETERPMVNWDVVGRRVDALTTDAQILWDKFTRQMTGPP